MTQPQQIENRLHFIAELGQSDFGLLFLLGLIILLFFVFSILCFLMRFLSDFFEELQMLNMDIARSTDKDERRCYRRLRLRLWLFWLPFFRD